MKTYKEDIVENIIQCSACQECKLTNKLGCVPLWQYGDNFGQRDLHILFVGKTARGENPPHCYELADILYKESWPFWKYTRLICEKLNLKWEDIAVTNLIKCNTSDGIDKTTFQMKQNCIMKRKFIQKEISILNPSHIVFYTHDYYDTEIKQIFDNIQNISSTDAQNRIACGKKKMPFWKFKGQIQGQSFCVLRLGHPQGKKQEDFVGIVVDFIKSTSKIKSPR